MKWLLKLKPFLSIAQFKTGRSIYFTVNYKLEKDGLNKNHFDLELTDGILPDSQLSFIGIIH